MIITTVVMIITIVVITGIVIIITNVQIVTPVILVTTLIIVRIIATIMLIRLKKPMCKNPLLAACRCSSKRSLTNSGLEKISSLAWGRVWGSP